MRHGALLLTGAFGLFTLNNLMAQGGINLVVNANMDIYRAGGYNDGSDGVAPVVYTFRAGGTRTITFTSTGGGWTCQNGYPDYSADGETSGYCFTAGGPTNFDSIGPLSGYHLTDFTGAMAGVFLEDNLPTSAPPALRFYVSNSSQGGIPTSTQTLSPEIGQVFFIGDGLTGSGSGSLQVFAVPPTATHLYLGYVDNCRAPGNTIPGCYSDNSGSINAVVSLHNYVPEWRQPALTTAPTARLSPAFAYDELTHSGVLFGGGNGRIPGVVYGDTWIWHDGWKQVSPPASPPARCCAGMAYDRITRTTVLFGGQDGNGTVFNDTWTWDGLTWTQQFPAVSPPGRSHSQGMSYDPLSATVVLFGGEGNENTDYGGAVFGDTWQWEGRNKTWAQNHQTTSPAPRTGAPFVFDPVTKTVILFGGDDGGGDCCRTFFDDTWAWNGTFWVQLSPSASPPQRTGASMAFDKALNEMILFGGTAGPPEGLNDTWAFDGTSWTPLRATQPAGLWDSAILYDPSIHALVLFGGEATGDVLSNQTWLFGLVPVP